MKLKLVIVNIEANSQILSSPERFCSEERLLRAAGIADPEKRLQSYAAELALSYALSGDKLLKPSYAYAENGRPVLEGGFISLAHTKGFAAAAVFPAPVGVDVETPRSVSPHIARRVLCPAEEAFFKKTGNGLYLLEKFVLKEAFLKMTGEGLGGGFRELYDTHGLVFRNGIRAGFVTEAGVDGLILRAVTADMPDETETIILERSLGR